MPQPLDTGVLLRRLTVDDADALSSYFVALSPETNRRFQPHPLTADVARSLCAHADSPTLRFVVESDEQIIAYFILEPVVSTEEADRFLRFGITLLSGLDFRFAPSVADVHQNTGIASQVMPQLIAFARAAGARSLVLMGGTQATNARAIAFYEKFGFERFGGYQTDVFNHDMRLLIGA
jgi:diamine N-acetyltransferase